MKKLIISACLVVGGLTAHAGQPMTAEEHAKQVMLAKQNQIQPSGVVFVTVGDEVSCDFRLGATRIQDAIDSGVGEIRIADSVYNENLVIDDISVTLRGGFDSCPDAENDIQSTSIQTVTGVAAGSPTVLIQGNTQRNTVTIEQLSITGGDGSGFFAGGGITTFAADLQLNITRSWLSNNNGTLGAGMAIITGDTDATLEDVWVVSNVSSGDAGGIYCSGTDASVFISDTGPSIISGVVNNSAAGDGGGAYITAGCTLTSFSGSADGGFDFRGFSGNSATENGGGIAVDNGSSVSLIGSLFCFFGCIGDNTQPISLLNNQATLSGGAVYASGAGTTLSINNALIQNNTADAAGGGIALANEATLTMGSVYAFGTCWNPGECSLVEGNETDPANGLNRAGGLYVSSGSTADVSRTAFRGNRADFGTAIYVHSEDGGVRSSLDLEGALVAGNGNDGADGFSDANAIRVTRADAKIDFSTIADNNATLASIDARVTGAIEMYSSIVHEPGLNVYSGSSTDLTADCLIVNENASIPSASEDVVDDPEFVDRVGGDFHLDAAISPALDFCDTFFSAPDFNDMDDDVRGFDDPTATNNLGPYDVGYDESYDNDIIFEHGFDD